MASWVEKWSVQKRESGKEYIVSKADDGTWGCSCPAWTFKRTTCKHIGMVSSATLFNDGGTIVNGYEIKNVLSQEPLKGDINDVPPSDKEDAMKHIEAALERQKDEIAVDIAGQATGRNTVSTQKVPTVMELINSNAAK